MSEKLSDTIFQEWNNSNKNTELMVSTLEQLSNAEADKQSKLNLIDSTIKATYDQISDMSSDSDLMNYETLKTTGQLINAEKAKLDQEYQNNIKNIYKQISEQTNKISGLESEKTGLVSSLSTSLEDIKKTKNNIQTVNWEDLQSKPKSETDIRAEDIPFFNLYIRYNGLTHKILKKCSLTGHSHAISAGDGSCIKEQYSFIAREIV